MPPRPETITTRSNAVVARFRQARDGRDAGCTLVEGPTLVEELLNSSWTLKEALILQDPERDDQTTSLLNRLLKKAVPFHPVSPSVMEFVSDLKTPTSLAVRVERPAPLSFSALGALGHPHPLFVLLDGVQSPSNAGAVVRVAEAAGAHAVGALPGTADLLSPRTLRASAGSGFRIPLFTVKDLPALLNEFPAPPQLLAADAKGTTVYTDFEWANPCFLILGSETHGVTSPAKMGLTVQSLRIPMSGKTESLNISVAAGVLLMEARRQRNG